MPLSWKKRLGTYCAPCHGSHHPEGDLFAILTHGANGMPPFRADLTAKERWLVVA